MGGSKRRETTRFEFSLQSFCKAHKSIKKLWGLNQCHIMSGGKKGKKKRSATHKPMRVALKGKVSMWEPLWEEGK